MAKIAIAHVSAATWQRIQELMGNDDLAALSTWADEVRNQHPETYDWHFVDIPWNAEGFSEARDCYRPDDPHAPQDRHNCVVDRIEEFERVLADKKVSRDERREALKFVVHFVGDAHQPLHAVGRARGGNDIKITFFGSPDCGGRPCNLHWVWDIGLIEHAQRPEASYALYLEQLIVRRNLRSRTSGSAPEWANESFHLAHDVWLEDGGRVDEAYYRKNIEIVNERLALAGLRLARLLNEAFR